MASDNLQVDDEIPQRPFFRAVAMKPHRERGRDFRSGVPCMSQSGRRSVRIPKNRASPMGFPEAFDQNAGCRGFKGQVVSRLSSTGMPPHAFRSDAVLRLPFRPSAGCQSWRIGWRLRRDRDGETPCFPGFRTVSHMSDGGSLPARQCVRRWVVGIGPRGFGVGDFKPVPPRKAVDQAMKSGAR